MESRDSPPVCPQNTQYDPSLNRSECRGWWVMYASGFRHSKFVISQGSKFSFFCLFLGQPNIQKIATFSIVNTFYMNLFFRSNFNLIFFSYKKTRCLNIWRLWTKPSVLTLGCKEYWNITNVVFSRLLNHFQTQEALFLVQLLSRQGKDTVANMVEDVWRTCGGSQYSNIRL